MDGSFKECDAKNKFQSGMARFKCKITGDPYAARCHARGALNQEKDAHRFARLVGHLILPRPKAHARCSSVSA